MVYLKDLFSLLATGEFSSIGLSRSRTGSITESEYDRVIGHLNLGIVEIFKRFPFLQETFNLHVDPTVTKYFLQNDRRAILNDITTTAYIEVPVVDATTEIRMVEVSGIFDSTDEELKLNNRYATPSIKQMTPEILHVTGLEEADVWSIIYQSYPAKIVLSSTFDLDTETVDIPEFVVDALLNYVAWKTYKPRGANDSTAGAEKGVAYHQQYELAMTKLEMYGLDPQDADEEDTFLSNGWA